MRCSSFRSLTSMVLPRLARGTSMRARAVAVRPMATGMTTTRLETLSSGRLTWSILRLRVRKKRFAGEGSKATMLARVRRRSSTVHAPTLAPISSNTPSGSPGMGSDGRDEGTGTSRPCHKRVYMPQSRHDPLLTIRSETTCFHRDSNFGSLARCAGTTWVVKSEAHLASWREAHALVEEHAAATYALAVPSEAGRGPAPALPAGSERRVVDQCTHETSSTLIAKGMLRRDRLLSRRPRTPSSVAASHHVRQPAEDALHGILRRQQHKLNDNVGDAAPMHKHVL